MRALRIAAAAVAAAALLIGLALYGYGRGWHLSPRPPSEISAQLRPHDEVFVPRGAGPFPAVVMLHGCGGKRQNSRDWARRFRAAGYVAVIVDSFAERGLTGDAVCVGRALLPAERAAHALVSLDDARRLPAVDPERVVLAGWSHGGVALIQLLVMDPPTELPPGLAREPALGLDGLAGVLFVYPYCGVGSRAGVWASRVPSLFLLAEEDTTADPAPCLALVDQLREAGRDVAVEVYPRVDHAFDFRAPDDPARAGDWRRATEAGVARALEFLARVTRGAG